MEKKTKAKVDYRQRERCATSNNPAHGRERGEGKWTSVHHSLGHSLILSWRGASIERRNDLKICFPPNDDARGWRDECSSFFGMKMESTGTLNSNSEFFSFPFLPDFPKPNPLVLCRRSEVHSVSPKRYG